uniref:NADH-ubiquinone oxidoreductase subunit 1b n=1 Tax=Nyctotherus ovalis TaxID=70075 RepID=F1AAI5_NYCOV|nr:NADH-ubiquinone oxidoreductase subunit 1b [Nyctotherus ovalis]
MTVIVPSIILGNMLITVCLFLIAVYFFLCIVVYLMDDFYNLHVFVLFAGMSYCCHALLYMSWPYIVICFNFIAIHVVMLLLTQSQLLLLLLLGSILIICGCIYRQDSLMSCGGFLLALFIIWGLLYLIYVCCFDCIHLVWTERYLSIFSLFIVKLLRLLAAHATTAFATIALSSLLLIILCILLVIRGGAPRYRVEQQSQFVFNLLLLATIIFIAAMLCLYYTL